MLLARLAPSALLVPALALMGCGDDPPAPVRGGATVQFLDDGPSGPQGCQHTGHSLQIGSVTDTAKDTLIASGSEETTVKCKITGNYAVEGTITRSHTSIIDFVVPSITSGANATSPVEGRVGFGTATTQTTYRTKDEPCTFWFTPSQGITANSVFMTFACSKIVAGTSECRLGQSYIAFEGCAGAPEDD